MQFPKKSLRGLHLQSAVEEATCASKRVSRSCGGAEESWAGSVRRAGSLSGPALVHVRYASPTDCRSCAAVGGEPRGGLLHEWVPGGVEHVSRAGWSCGIACHQGSPSVFVGRPATCEGTSGPWVVDAALCIRVMHVHEVVPRHGRIGVHPRFEARVPCWLAVHRTHLHQAGRVAAPSEGMALYLVGVEASRKKGAGVNGLVERRHVLLDRVQPVRGEGTWNARRRRSRSSRRR